MSIDNDIDYMITSELEDHQLIIPHRIAVNKFCPICGAEMEENLDCFGEHNGYKNTHRSLAECVKFLTNEIKVLKKTRETNG